MAENKKHYTCPNCGASITNTMNCEYCGSLLVRFLDQNIDLSKTTFLDNSYNCDGLQEALEENLKMQASTSEPVTTDIYAELDYNEGKRGCICSVMPSGMSKLDYLDGKNRRTGRGLSVSFYFETIADVVFSNSPQTVQKVKDTNEAEEERRKRFLALECAPLFKSRMKYISKLSAKVKVTEYYMDFGEDAVGAARIISRVIRDIYEAPQEGLEYETAQGTGITYRCKASAWAFRAGILMRYVIPTGIIFFVVFFGTLKFEHDLEKNGINPRVVVIALLLAFISILVVGYKHASKYK